MQPCARRGFHRYIQITIRGTETDARQSREPHGCPGEGVEQAAAVARRANVRQYATAATLRRSGPPGGARRRESAPPRERAAGKERRQESARPGEHADVGIAQPGELVTAGLSHRRRESASRDLKSRGEPSRSARTETRGVFRKLSNTWVQSKGNYSMGLSANISARTKNG
jgi:hypothetical protein